MAQLLSNDARLRRAQRAFVAGGDTEMASRAYGERMLGLLKAAVLPPSTVAEAKEKAALFRTHGSSEMLVAAMLGAALDVDRRTIDFRQATFESKTIAYVFGLPFGYTSTELAHSLSLLQKDVVRLQRRGAERKHRKAGA